MANTPKPAGPGPKKLSLVHCIITIALMILVGMIPPIAPITPYGMKVIGILVGIIYGMSTVDVFWTAICAILGLGLANGAIAGVVVSALGSPLVWGIIFSMIVVYCMQAEHVTDLFANWIISRKVLQGRPWLMSFAMLVGIAIIAMVNPIAAMLIFWNIVYATCDRAGLAHNSPWAQCMIFGSGFAAGSGVVCLPVMNNGLVVSNLYIGMMQQSLNPIKFVATMPPLVLVCIILYVLIARFILRIDVSALKALEGTFADRAPEKMNRRQKVVTIFAVGMIVILLLGSALPAGWAVTGMIKNLDLFGLAAIVLLFFAVVRVDGAPIVNLQEGASKGIIWPMVFMTALVVPLGSALTNENAGITALITNFLTPILEGKPAWVLVAIVVVVGVLLTNLAQNLVILSLLLPIIVAMSGVMNINIPAITILLALGTHFAFVLPSACPAAGMMFSNPNLKPTFAYKAALISMVICTVFVLTVGYLWVNLIW